MCAGHIIDDIVTALLACVSTASAFLAGMTFLLANARRSNPKRDHKSGPTLKRRGRLRHIRRAGSADFDRLPVDERRKS
jgi:hypothetical protein